MLLCVIAKRIVIEKYFFEGNAQKCNKLNYSSNFSFDWQFIFMMQRNKGRGNHIQGDYKQFGSIRVYKFSSKHEQQFCACVNLYRQIPTDFFMQTSQYELLLLLAVHKIQILNRKLNTCRFFDRTCMTHPHHIFSVEQIKGNRKQLN